LITTPFSSCPVDHRHPLADLTLEHHLHGVGIAHLEALRLGVEHAGGQVNGGGHDHDGNGESNEHRALRPGDVCPANVCPADVWLTGGRVPCGRVPGGRVVDAKPP
jgi:hypothetical protein